MARRGIIQVSRDVVLQEIGRLNDFLLMRGSKCSGRFNKKISGGINNLRGIMRKPTNGRSHVFIRESYLNSIKKLAL